MKKSAYFLVGASLLAIALITTPSCNKDQVAEPIPLECPDTISFATTVEPLIQQNCSTSGCHDASAAGGYNLEGHGNISTNANAILTAIRHENSGLPMPLGQPKLSDTIIQQVDCWIKQGALDN
ncbi:MAG: hypothetical protein AB8B56_21610 [Crocinitomicaceae bacterium]